MTEYSEINIEQWSRKAQFEFFKEFDIPFFNLTTNIDVTHLREFCKQEKVSFFLASLYFSQKMAHTIPEFRTRLVNGNVHEYTNVKAGITVIMPDETFIYVKLDYQDDFAGFIQNARASIDAQKANAEFKPHKQPNIIYYSSVPWVSFTGVSHARNLDKNDCIPRVVFGKYFEDNGKWKMPLSLEGHHALMDGFHMGKYFNGFQESILWQALNNL